MKTDSPAQPAGATSIRVTGIPVDHVVAEMAAFPLASVAGLRGGATVLEPDLPSGSPTESLWRGAERTILGSFPAFSVDEAVAIRDKVWFEGPLEDPVPLSTYLRRLAAAYLKVEGTQAYPLLPSDQSALDPGSPPQALARRRWRWLSFALPPDLLLAALDTNGQGPDRVELIDPALARNLEDCGFAECHLHVGAALDFPLWWISAVRGIVDLNLNPEAFASPGAELDEGRLLGPWLVRAALARYVLATYLAHPDRPRFRDFGDYLKTEVWRCLAAAATPSRFALLRAALRDLMNGDITGTPRRFRRFQDLYALITQVGALKVPSGVSAARRADPIRFLAPDDTRSAEMAFVASALRYVERVGTGVDPLFETLFWQVVRLRCLFYRHVVQRPMTPGLQWFVRFYGRIGAGRRALDLRTQIESAADLCGVGKGLCSLEIRTSPSASCVWLTELVRTVDEMSAAAREKGYELGIVFHFTKHRGGGAGRGRPAAHGRGSNADPDPARRRQSKNVDGYRFSNYYKSKREEAVTLARLLRERPLTLRVVRGLDACTDELGVPNWVLSPLFERVRIGAEDAMLALREQGVDLPRLRTTVHAGEDFVHLLSGLRLLDEAVEAFGLRASDRIGHALALGVDPRDWARRAGRIPLSREERLFDLQWEWTWSSRAGGMDSSRLHSIEHEIAVLANRIFGPRCKRPIGPLEIEQLSSDLLKAHRLDAVGFPVGFPGGSPVHYKDPQLGLLYLYLTDRGVFERGREIVWVDPSVEGEVLVRLQAELRGKLGRRSIAVEVNPTSNLLIGDLSDLLKHPIWRLQPPRPEVVDAPPVAIAIGSDDPLVFGSDLRHEYQWLKDAMALAGLSDEESRRWLDRTRACGLEHRFTLARGDREPTLLSVYNGRQPSRTLPI